MWFFRLHHSQNAVSPNKGVETRKLACRAPYHRAPIKVVTPSTTHLVNDFSALKTIKTSHYYSSGTYPTRTDDLQINTSAALPASPRSHITGVDFAVNPTACVHKCFQTYFARLLSLTGWSRRFQLSLPTAGRSWKAVKEHRYGGFFLFTPTKSLCAFRADRTPHFVNTERIPH